MCGSSTAKKQFKSLVIEGFLSISRLCSHKTYPSKFALVGLFLPAIFCFMAASARYSPQGFNPCMVSLDPGRSLPSWMQFRAGHHTSPPDSLPTSRHFLEILESAPHPIKSLLAPVSEVLSLSQQELRAARINCRTVRLCGAQQIMPCDSSTVWILMGKFRPLHFDQCFEHSQLIIRETHRSGYPIIHN